MTKEQAAQALEALQVIKDATNRITTDVHYLSNVDVDNVMLLHYLSEFSKYIDISVTDVHNSVVEEEANA
jgi:hypothetical protein